MLKLLMECRKGLPKYRMAVFFVAGYVALGYLVVMICFFFVWCRPFHVYYDTIPVPDSECTLYLFHSIRSPTNIWSSCTAECMTYRHHMLIEASFNITSEAVMLCLPIPLVVRAKVPLARKLVLVAVFGLGGIVVSKTFSRSLII